MAMNPMRISMLALLLLAAPAYAAPPIFQANSNIAAAASAGADPTVTLPAHALNDILLLATVVRDGTATVATPAGWTELGTPTVRASTATYQFFWKRAAGSTETNPLIDRTGTTGDVYAVVNTYRGAFTTGDPWEVVGAAATGTSDPAICTGITTATADSLVVVALAGEDDNNDSVTTTGTNPAAYDEHYRESNVGSDGMVTFSEFFRSTAGATGNVTVAFGGGKDAGNPVGWGCRVLALKPVPVPPLGGFNAYETSTAANATTGVIKTKIAGTATISFDIIALNTAKTAIETAFTSTVRVELLNSSDDSGTTDANGCKPTWTVIQTLSPDPTFAAAENGRKTITITQAESYPNARVRITHPAGAPTVTGCSNDNFAIRPDKFISLVASDNDWETAGTGRTLNNKNVPGGVVHKAGRPFTLRATAVNGDGKSATTTTNYAGTATGSPSDCGKSSACLNSGFGTVTVGASFAAGQLNSSLATYSEVGAVSLELVDATFANVDLSDGSTAAQREIWSNKADVGRFVPDHFDVTTPTPPVSPVFKTFNDAACATRSFTYIGQPFGYATVPVAKIFAKNFGGVTTANYAGVMWRLTNASASQTFANSPVMSLNAAGIGTPTVTEIASTGTGNYTLNASDTLTFVRDNATPQAPFNASLSLTMSVSDATEAGANQGTITTNTPLVYSGEGAGIAFDAGNAFRYGRVRIINANGSQLTPLAVPVEAQYWNGTAFITNAADSCTTVATANLAMSNFTDNLTACETSISGGGVLSAGRRTLQLSGPGSANNGSVRLTVNLALAASGTTCVGGAVVTATTANRPYLQGNWTGASYDQNPFARDTFGVYRGADEVIFVRENFQ
jgi:MSHA biogenesis protein MshQ